MERILLIDDDTELCSLVTEYLESEGFHVEAVHNGEQGLSKATAGNSALVILDVMLPGRNGFDLLRELRKTSKIPVLLLTARGQEIDRIVGLEIGADDYLPKPFHPRELVARMRAILRRTQSHGHRNGLPEPPATLHVGDIELDPSTRTASRAGKSLDLTSVEFNLLEALLRDAGRVVSREQLTLDVLSRKFSPFDRSIDMHVSKLRKKLGDTAEECIKTVRGSGYLLARPLEKVGRRSG